MQGNGIDRFDLEFAITDCYNIADDIGLVAEHIMESDSIDPDHISNMLVGIQEITKLRIEKAFYILEELIRTGKI